MPPKIKITRNEIIDTAVNLVRENGEQAINARNIANALNCSTQPIFSNFTTMDELRSEVKNTGNNIYQNYLKTDISSGKYPPYKASGMAYIRFAREESELFKLLFMCDRSNETIEEDRDSIRAQLEMIEKNLAISEDEAHMFHLKMWIYVHGIATMIATSYLDLDEPLISELVTDAYMGMKHHYEEE